MMEPKGTFGIVIMNDNAPAKVVTIWPWHYDELNFASLWVCRPGVDFCGRLVGRLPFGKIGQIYIHTYIYIYIQIVQR